jgi:hypothetical protein
LPSGVPSALEGRGLGDAQVQLAVDEPERVGVRDVAGGEDFAVLVEDVQEGVSMLGAALAQEPERAARADEMLVLAPGVSMPAA